MSVNFLGDCEVHDAAEGGSVECGIGTIRTTVVKTGKYDDLLPIQPIPGEFNAISSNLEGKRGGMGVLTYVTEVKLEIPDTGEGDVPTSTTKELTWQQVEKPLLSHPDAYPDVRGVDIDAWKNEPDIALKLEYKYSTPTGVISLVPAAVNFAKLIEKGVESYLAFSPVFSITRVWPKRPSSGGCGKRGNPTLTGYATGYQYLKTADTVVQNADLSWTQTEQWTGAEEWSELLYKDAT